VCRGSARVYPVVSGEVAFVMRETDELWVRANRPGLALMLDVFTNVVEFGAFTYRVSHENGVVVRTAPGLDAPAGKVGAIKDRFVSFRCVMLCLPLLCFCCVVFWGLGGCWRRKLHPAAVVLREHVRPFFAWLVARGRRFSVDSWNIQDEE